MNIQEINELTRVAYNQTAEKYHHHFRNEIEEKEYDRNILNRFSDALPQDALICDAGCGPSGHIGKYLLNKGHKVIGIDISEKCIEIAQSYQPEIDFKLMDMANTDFEDETFDGLIAFYSIIYTPKNQVDKIFKEFNRILKVGGKVLLVVKKGKEAGIINNDWYEGNPVYFTHFMEDEIKGYFEDNGIEIDFLETRQPYDFEFNVDRIYAIAKKNNLR